RTGGQWVTTMVASSNTSQFTGVWGASDNDIWLAGGGLQRWDGQAWQYVIPPSAVQLLSPAYITGSGANDVWFFGGWYGSGQWDGSQFVAHPELTYEYLTGGWVH